VDRVASGDALHRAKEAMLSTEQKIRRGFHWVAVILAAVLLAIGLVLTTFDVGDLWHADGEDIPLALLSSAWWAS
jgi:hypothetical protein